MLSMAEPLSFLPEKHITSFDLVCLPSALLRDCHKIDIARLKEILYLCSGIGTNKYDI